MNRRNPKNFLTIRKSLCCPVLPCDFTDLTYADKESIKSYVLYDFLD